MARYDHQTPAPPPCLTEGGDREHGSFGDRHWPRSPRARPPVQDRAGRSARPPHTERRPTRSAPNRSPSVLISVRVVRSMPPVPNASVARTMNRGVVISRMTRAIGVHVPGHGLGKLAAANREFLGGLLAQGAFDGRSELLDVLWSRTTSACRPSSTNSLTPARALTTSGSPLAIASIAGRWKEPFRDGATRASAAAQYGKCRRLRPHTDPIGDAHSLGYLPNLPRRCPQCHHSWTRLYFGSRRSPAGFYCRAGPTRPTGANADDLSPEPGRTTAVLVSPAQRSIAPVARPKEPRSPGRRPGGS